MDNSNEEGTDKNTIDGGYGQYGLEVTNPIPVDSIDSSYAYLERLRTINGAKIKYKRKGSTIIPNIKKPIDAYEIFEDDEVITTIYIHAYNVYNSQKSPKGFILKE